ncbi:MAG: type II toxin-antitoxin system RelE/ParE family toxin [bacterium]|nr:type II toxin-antitoxin system RelE/ParE family toxin [bacterium]
MNYTVAWSKNAENSLDDILNYIIENDGANIAQKIYKRIQKKTTLLKVSPLQGSSVSELKTFGKKYRQVIEKPWRIIYKIDNDIITVLLVIDGRRDLEEILFEMIVNSDNA